MQKASCFVFQSFLDCLSSDVLVSSRQSDFPYCNNQKKVKLRWCKKLLGAGGICFRDNISFFLLDFDHLFLFLLKEKVADVCRN